MQYIPLSPKSATVPGASPSGKNPSSSVGKEVDNLEQHIAALLGDHMPLSEIPSPGESTSSSATDNSLLPHFMSLRLLLLRSSARRSLEENELLDVLKKSFHGYSKDNRRSGAELARLLAKDWMYLKSSIERRGSQPTTTQHNSHVMPAPAGRSYTPTGIPVGRPSPFPALSHPSVPLQSGGSMPLACQNRLVSSSSLGSLPKNNSRQLLRSNSNDDNNSRSGDARPRGVSSSPDNLSGLPATNSVASET